MTTKEELKRAITKLAQLGVLYGASGDNSDHNELKQLIEYEKDVMSMIDELYAQHTKKEQQ